MNMEECLREGYLRRMKPDRALAEKEFKEAEYDLGKSKKSLMEEDYKWAVVMAYYCMFHSGKAVLFSLGYREKKHIAVQAVIEELVRKGQLESVYLDYYKAAFEAREDADYRYTYSKDVAEDIIEYAEKFMGEMKEFCASQKP
jgi:uncharacterized protein (UPF0332 family)